jgi:hypothetical protein
MAPEVFDSVAKNNGLTRKELVTLSLCQSQIYHSIKFDNQPDAPTTGFMIGAIKPATRRVLSSLQDKGVLHIDSRDILEIADRGWSIPCNAGASVFIGGCNDQDVIEGISVAPKTRFGPKDPPLETRQQPEVLTKN